ncbi:MAG: TonB-dependent receptor plug domain-containing protein [Deltaproteobacteria bacterium]
MICKKIVFSISFLFIFLFDNTGQDLPADTVIHKEMEEMIITATRNEKQLRNVTVPFILINSRTIEQSGSIRLHEVLQEQTGLFLSSGTGSTSVGGGVFGNGIQIQGMSPDYTLIMLDGEPLIGRHGGIIDLSRFTVGNIRKIEVIKGPSSALYGSEAMGGVINILTEQRRNNYFSGGLRFGSFYTTDIYSSANIDHRKSTIYLFGNYNSSQGYDLNRSTVEKTLDPYMNTSFHLKFVHRFSERANLFWSNRFFRGIQKSEFAINSSELNINGSGKTTELNINPVFTNHLGDNFKSSLKLYMSYFSYLQDLKHIGRSEQYYKDDFRQSYYKIEEQIEWNHNKNMELVAGGGYNVQKVVTSRYKSDKILKVSYIFVQNEWNNNKWTVITGLRYDINSAYSNRLSPKISGQYNYSDKLKINFSYGSGFKSPDFRQLYLYYINPAAQGYRVYGASEFSVNELEKQLEQGLITKILPEAYLISELHPEISHGFNLSANFKAKTSPSNIDINLFYNNVKDLINYLPVAYTNNNSLVFSYMNIKKAFTGGIDINLGGPLRKSFEWNAGYQFLMTGDQDIIKNILNDSVYGRDEPLGSARKMKFSDYGGLLGRSPHMLNFKIIYNHQEKGLSASARVIYRSRWGVVDLDGNGFANMKDEYAKGNAMLNMSVQKRISKNIIGQMSVNNILNQTDAINSPHNPGINVIGSIQWNF